MSVANVCGGLDAASTATAGHAHDGNGNVNIVNPGPAQEGNNGNKRRRLAAEPSIDFDEAEILHQKVRTQPLPAASLRTLDGLKDLAAANSENFKHLTTHSKHGSRPTVPPFKIRIGTACTGSSADLVSMIAIKQALADSGTDFSFEYVFNCEKDGKKRPWIAELHKVLGPLGATALGHDSLDSQAPAPGHDMPCLFEDIQELKNGTCKCYTHTKAKKPGNCAVRDIDFLFCSTSCKDLSKLNPNKSGGTTLDGADTAGGSVQTFNGLCDLLEMLRPDLLVYENVVDIADEKADGGSNLEIARAKWHALGYDTQVAYCSSKIFGLPQDRRRCFVLAINAQDPQTFVFKDRSVADVLRTFTQLLKVCHRKPECASKYLLDDDDVRVRSYLQALQREAADRTDLGYNQEKPMQVAEQAGIQWGHFPPTAMMQNSPWYHTMTHLQKDSVCFSLAAQPAKHFFRDVKCSFGRTRLNPRPHEETGGIHIASTCVPNQLWMVFDEAREPRLVLGREYLWLQGFPIDEICKMQGNFKESFLTDLAGNMVSTTIFLGIVQSAMAALSWLPGTVEANEEKAEPQQVAAGDFVDEVFNDLCDQIPDGETGATTAADDDDGLLQGPTTGLADDGAKGGMECRGGLLKQVFGKVQKTF